MAGAGTDIDPALVALLQTSSTRFVSKAAGGPWPDRDGRHLAWGPTNIARHLATITDYFHDVVLGGGSTVPSLADLAQTNNKGLRSYEATGWPATLDQMRGRLSAILEELSTGDDRRFRWHGGIELGLTETIGVLTGEFLIHEWDLDRTLRRRPDLSIEDCQVLTPALRQILPHVLDRERSSGVDSSWRIAVRGISPFDVRIRDQAMTVGPPVGRGRSPRSACRG